MGCLGEMGGLLRRVLWRIRHRLGRLRSRKSLLADLIGAEARLGGVGREWIRRHLEVPVSQMVSKKGVAVEIDRQDRQDTGQVLVKSGERISMRK